MIAAHAVLDSGAVSTDTLSGPPPWRWRAFARFTSPAGFDDARARALFLAALVGADGAESLSAVGTALGVSERTVVRARVWIKAHDRAGWALLRVREAGPEAATKARVPGWERLPDGSAPRARKRKVKGGPDAPEQPTVDAQAAAEPEGKVSRGLGARPSTPV